MTRFAGIQIARTGTCVPRKIVPTASLTQDANTASATIALLLDQVILAPLVQDGSLALQCTSGPNRTVVLQ
jgi:hypothetical protein